MFHTLIIRLTRKNSSNEETDDIKDPERDNERSDSLDSSDLQYPIRQRSKSQRFTVCSLARAHSENEPRAQQAIPGYDKDEWKTVMRHKIETLDKIECWDVLPRPKSDKVLHSKFILKEKRSDEGYVIRYKARFVVRGNEENDNEEMSFYPVPDFTTIKLVMCIAKQRWWIPR